ncbi:hypothetical protein N0V82_003449 [Gnomoniopsis sp. IMI 355080]|nr:hypothetical protein N0V82_003449 [Gnomoniopsis sp. IMI 355080]
MAYNTLPAAATLTPTPFEARVPDEELGAFTQLLKLSKIAPETYENRIAEVKDFRHWGISRDWLAKAKQHWETSYSWRKTEDRINSFPNFTVPIENGGTKLDIHLVALYSEKKDATPLLLLHGWPGSFLEFLGALDVLRGKYGPAELPFHVIVPSLPGYGYSSGPPLDGNFQCEDIASVMDKLMVGLGFGGGYVTQGGDIGSFVSRILGKTSASCKAVHLNLCIGVDKSQEVPVSSLSKEEQAGLERNANFGTLGNAYAREHGTRPSTIGLVLSSSPLALLAWIGEKFLAWTDVSPPLDEILDSVTLYWFTSSFPRCIYPYRQFFGPSPASFHNSPDFYLDKPMGYSWHHRELAPIPKAWVEKTGNLVWYRGHFEGGHFAAMEKPELFVKDMEDFVGELKTQGTV